MPFVKVPGLIGKLYIPEPVRRGRKNIPAGTVSAASSAATTAAAFADKTRLFLAGEPVPHRARLVLTAART